MNRESSNRFLTTHAGSLPRSPELFAMLVRVAAGELSASDLDDRLVPELAAVVQAQLDAGIDIVNDGELGRKGFTLEHPARMSGFSGVSPNVPMADVAHFPDYAAKLERWMAEGNERLAELSVAGGGKATVRPFAPPMATGEITYEPQRAAIGKQLDQFSAALSSASASPTGTFVTAPTPGIISTSMRLSPDSPAYESDRSYLFALAEALSVEYRAIVEQGHTLQLDGPDLAMERHFMFADRPESEFLERLAWHVEALNHALDGIPLQQTRVHVCWGNYDGPHTCDIELETILPSLLELEVGGIMLPLGNPRHQHDWKVLRDGALPGSVTLLAGVIDVTTNVVEHPEVVADRLVRIAEAVGDPSRVIASTDCGMSTFAGYMMLAEDVAWAKLRSLSEGAQIASSRVFGA